MRQTTSNWIKKILEEATTCRIVNVFLKSWFFYLFLLFSRRLLVKYDFMFRYEGWVNALRAFSFIENFPQISEKPIAFQRNLLGKLSRNRPFFTNCFSAKLASKISREIGRLVCEFVPENPAKFDRAQLKLLALISSWLISTLTYNWPSGYSRLSWVTTSPQ